MTAIVSSVGRDRGNGHVISGDAVEAELVKEIGQGYWFVRFPDDLDENGKPVLRVRHIV